MKILCWYKKYKNWKCNRSVLFQSKFKTKKYPLHPGRKPFTSKNEEEEILKFIKSKRKLGNAISSNQIIIRLCHIKPAAKENL